MKRYEITMLTRDTKTGLFTNISQLGTILASSSKFAVMKWQLLDLPASPGSYICAYDPANRSDNFATPHIEHGYTNGHRETLGTRQTTTPTEATTQAELSQAGV